MSHLVRPSSLLASSLNARSMCKHLTILKPQRYSFVIAYGMWSKLEGLFSLTNVGTVVELPNAFLVVD